MQTAHLHHVYAAAPRSSSSPGSPPPRAASQRCSASIPPTCARSCAAGCGRFSAQAAGGERRRFRPVADPQLLQHAPALVEQISENHTGILAPANGGYDRVR
jgi:hypothetical protein